jgi:hypothetical protein
MRPWSPLRTLGIPLVVVVLVSACGGGGGGGGGSAVDPNAPVLSNLRVSFGPRCMLPGSLAGTIEALAFEFADADGNVRGGTVDNTTTGAGGGSITLSGGIPSPGVTITGPSTSGTVTITACLRFDGFSSVTETVTVTDASGKASNVLSLEVPRPGGAPLLPRDADPAIRKSL